MASTNGITKLNIGIIGYGVVGSALGSWLVKHTKHNIYVYDPAKGWLDKTELCDVTFLCIPVPTKENGEQDYSILEASLPRAGGIKFIRSTVLPGTNDRFGTYSCPEFLTERTAYDDTANMDVISGYNDILLMEKLFPGKKIIYMKNVEAEIAKYAHNCMGAIKVNFFNLIHSLCELRGASYERVLDGVLLSGYVNKEHVSVPGPDGHFGFGGKCFPKDLKAFNHFYPTKTFQACIDENIIHRGTGSLDWS